MPKPLGGAPLHLSLLGGFELTSDGRRLSLPLLAQRLVAFLVLHEGWVDRALLAATLWPDAPPPRAAASLRSALWRLPRSGVCIVEARRTRLRLSTAVRVDLHERTALARRVVAFDDPDFLPLGEVAEWGEVLPDWYDDWVLDAHDTFHRLRVEALECACAAFTARGQYARAVDSGLAAIAGEPLRESAHRVLMCAYLAEGNPGEALREYNLYRDLLKTELGLEPSPTMVALSTTVRRS